jgi:hypothetical protein
MRAISLSVYSAGVRRKPDFSVGIPLGNDLELVAISVKR